MKRTFALLCTLILLFAVMSAPASASGQWRDIVSVVCVQGCTVALRGDGTVLYAGDPAFPASRETRGWSDVEWIESQDSGRYLVGHSSDGRVFLSLLQNPNEQYDVYFEQGDVSDWSEVRKVVIKNFQCLGLRYDGSFYTVSIGDEAYAAARASWNWPNLADIDTDGYNLILGLKSDGTVLASDEQLLLDSTGYWGAGSSGMSEWRQVSEIYCTGCGVFAIRPDTVLGMNRSGWSGVGSLYIAPDSMFGLRRDGTVAANFEDEYYRNDYRLQQVGSWRDIVQLGFDGAWRYVPVGLRRDGTVCAVTSYDGSEPYGQWDFRGWSDVTALFSGSDYTLGLRKDGSLLVTGGEFDCAAYLEPLRRWNDVQWIYPAQGEHTDHIVALRNDGTLLAAGDNSCGQCSVN